MKQEQKQEKHFIVDVLFVLALFVVFTFSALMLVTIGAEVYRHTVDDMDSNYETRTSIAYLTEKIRQNDNAAANICISTLAEQPVLTFSQYINEETYCTYLYMHEGYLKELFIKPDSYVGDNVLAAGQNIMELKSFTVEQVSDNLLSIQITTTNNEFHEIFISIHCAP